MFLWQALLNKPDLLQDTLLFSFNAYKRIAHQGGHTYMSTENKKQYTRLLTSRTNVFRVSIHLRNTKNISEQEQLVWDAMNVVLTFLETNSERASIQQSINTRRGLRTKDNQFRTTIGPIFPILTCLYLASTTTGGVDICMESYNTKADDVVECPIQNINNLTMEAASHIAFDLLDRLKHKIPCLIDRVSRFLQNLSAMELSARILRTTDIEFIFGVGCTVETTLRNTISTTSFSTSKVTTTSNQTGLHRDDYTSEVQVESDDEISESSSMNLSSDDDISIGEVSLCSEQYSNQSLTHEIQENILLQVNSSQHFPIHKKYEDENITAGYTIIRSELPSFAMLRDSPPNWFLTQGPNEQVLNV